ncbi:MAG: SPOR domain-containing protein [Fibromonadaceae bacterium]|jgi:hypothetical protein|nr:SPOR domain-containing protein [Fibromonadaceae bacterium]
MRKIAKLATMAAFFLPLYVVFADNGKPTDIDSLLKGREYQLPRLDASYRGNYGDVPQVKNTDNSNETYILQFDAVADFDAAQARRAKLQAQTGYDIQMVFDAPFYKLRGGYFKKKTDAEDKARELSLYNISAFAVKIK